MVRDLGEWHTHPQEVPSPSYVDLDEWKILAKGRADKRPLLAVVVGRQNLHVELMHADGMRHEFLQIGSIV